MYGSPKAKTTPYIYFFKKNYFPNLVLFCNFCILTVLTVSDLQPPISRHLPLGVGDCPTTPDEWDHILDKSLSGSEFDLLIHHSNTYPTDNPKSDKGCDNTPTSV